MNILLFPPIAFILIFIFVYVFFKMTTPPLNKKKSPETGVVQNAEKDEICDYHRFFLLAAFFILLHLAGLMISTWAFNPLPETIGPVLAYLSSVIIILGVLFI